jgi:16S rRNA U1498 N3-methylase RsmE
MRTMKRSLRRCKDSGVDQESSGRRKAERRETGPEGGWRATECEQMHARTYAHAHPRTHTDKAMLHAGSRFRST